MGRPAGAGGFAGNFVLSLADHAQNGFFGPAEWVGVVAGAWAVGSLVAVLAVDDNRPLLWCWPARRDGHPGRRRSARFFRARAVRSRRHDRRALGRTFSNGAPVFAPLLFADLALLACLGLWALVLAATMPHEDEAAQTKL